MVTLAPSWIQCSTPPQNFTPRFQRTTPWSTKTNYRSRMTNPTESMKIQSLWMRHSRMSSLTPLKTNTSMSWITNTPDTLESCAAIYASICSISTGKSQPQTFKPTIIKWTSRFIYPYQFISTLRASVTTSNSLNMVRHCKRRHNSSRRNTTWY